MANPTKTGIYWRWSTVQSCYASSYWDGSVWRTCKGGQVCNGEFASEWHVDKPKAESVDHLVRVDELLTANWRDETSLEYIADALHAAIVQGGMSSAQLCEHLTNLIDAEISRPLTED